MRVKRFILDLVISALLGLAAGIFFELKEVRRERERIYNDIKQIEWVKAAKETNPQNNYVGWGLERWK